MARYMAYRGEHGPVLGGYATYLPSLTFSTAEAASIYAMEPNHRGARLVAPRVIAAIVEINSPVMNDPGDPFIELSILRDALGFEKTREIVSQIEDAFFNTNNWLHEINGARQWTGPVEYIDADPAHIDNLYVDAWRVLDLPSAVEALMAAGYDGAIHGGLAATPKHPEYKVFDHKQATPLFSTTDRVWDEVAAEI